jgi:methyltransferase (TIGR00027 family)
MVAAARAFGAHDPDPSVRNPDWLAEHLLGPDELQLISEVPLSAALAQDYREAGRDPQVAGGAMLMIIRTRYIDERLVEAVRNGATQVVILGAGFDSRAYRLHELLRGAAVFEVDSPATQQIKKRRVEAVLGGAPRNVTYVPIDFNIDQLSDALAKGGYRPAEKTFFTWEGVSMYVAEDGVRETLRTVATQSAPGSSLVMDYTTRSAIELIKKMPDLPFVKQLASWGEPWIFGVPDGQEREFFLELGLEPAQMFAVFSPETIARYATRKDGTTFGITPGMPRPAPQQGTAAAAAAAAGRSGSFYSLCELIVPLSPDRVPPGNDIIVRS